MSISRIETSVANGFGSQINMDGYRSFSISNIISSNLKNQISSVGECNSNLDMNQYLISFILSNYSLPKIDLEKFSEIYLRFSQTNDGNQPNSTFLDVLKLLLIEAISSQSFNCEEDTEKVQRPSRNIIIKSPDTLNNSNDGTLLISN